MVTGWAVAYAKGWNGVMRDAVARGDVDTSALHAKVTTLDAMKARFSAEPSFRFNDDGRRVRDPSGRWELNTDGGSCLQITDAASAGVDHVFGYVHVRGATCVFADGGSTLCVRRDEGWRIDYETFDLERRITLQQFHEDTGKPRPST
jgi:hypothetical protein